LDILIVDDDQNMRSTLAAILSEDGYIVRTASNGEEAVELCRVYTFRLVLMDIRMPGIDGVETYRRIRVHCKRSQTVLMSAYVNPDLELAARQEGVLDILSKPLDIESVMQLIAKVMCVALLYVGESGMTEQLLNAELSQHRFRMSSTGNLADALSTMEQICFDAIVLDLLEEQLAEAVGAVRARHSDVTIFVVGDRGSGDRSAAHAADAWIERPIETEAVIRALEGIKRARLGRPADTDHPGAAKRV
jgi:DNA-binding response OmpR family regulator